MAAKLLVLQRSGLITFLALGHELHRVTEETEAKEAKVAKATKAESEKGITTHSGTGAKNHPRGRQPLGPEEAVETRLLGHAHLHALLVLPRGTAKNLALLLDTAATGADLQLDFVGGTGSPGKVAHGHRFQGHLTRCLRYILKEYRLEATEDLSGQLPPSSPDLPPSKFYLGVNPELFIRNPFPWDARTALLRNAIPQLQELKVKPSFGSLRQATVTDSLLQLLAFYTCQTGEFLVQNPNAKSGS